jgi:hypothetical protein
VKYKIRKGSKRGRGKSEIDLGKSGVVPLPMMERSMKCLVHEIVPEATAGSTSTKVNFVSGAHSGNRVWDETVVRTAVAGRNSGSK